MLMLLSDQLHRICSIRR